MGGKHKKFVRSEKAKVKLKGAKLPKGLNVTKTDFKVKKILIKEQIHQEFSENGAALKKHNLKEDLSRLKHHNDTYRLQALRNIKDFIVSNADEIPQNLSNIIQGISALCLDMVKDIRRESFKVLSIILSITSPILIQPFFDVMSSFLRCAMTHIQQNIQDDALLMLDVLLLHIPELVAANSQKIFTNFLNIISNIRSDAKPGRTLSVNMGNKVTTVKWRSKVLERLEGMLKILVQHKKEINNLRQECSTDLHSDDITMEDENTRINKRFILNRPTYFPIIKDNMSKNCNMSVLFKKVLGEKTNDIEDEGTEILKYAEQLLPLLFESWIEVRPIGKDLGNKTQNILSYDGASTLKIMLQIIENFCKLIKIRESEVKNTDLSTCFNSSYGKEFDKHLLGGFPYQQAEENKPSTKKRKGQPIEVIDQSGQQNCLQQNLHIVYLFCLLRMPIEATNQDHARSILQFTLVTLNNTKSFSQDCFKYLVEVLKAILYVNGNEFICADENETKAIFQAALKKHQNNMFAKNYQNKMFILLCDIILDKKLYILYNCKEYDEWIETLPQLLCRTNVSLCIINSFTNLSKQGNKKFLNALKNHAFNIIDNLTSIQINGCSSYFEGKKLIMNLFFWITDWSNEHKEQIYQRINIKITDDTIRNYFKCILLESSK